MFMKLNNGKGIWLEQNNQKDKILQNIMNEQTVIFKNTTFSKIEGSKLREVLKNNWRIRYNLKLLRQYNHTLSKKQI